MLVWKIDVMQELKERGYNFYTCKKSGILSQVTLVKLNHNEIPDIKTIDKLCAIFDCDIGDILQHVPDEDI